MPFEAMNEIALSPKKKMRGVAVQLDHWMLNRLDYLTNHGDPNKRAMYASEKRKMEEDLRAELQRKKVLA